MAAALIHRAIGDQLTCVFVDHGLLRLNEGDMVMDMFAGKLHAKVVRVDASQLFLDALKGVSDPEQKRKIIGKLFVDVFKAEAEKLKASDATRKGAAFLAQGTIYPDVIESGGAKSKKVTLLYLQSKKEYRYFQEQYVLMAGLILVVIGIYMLSKKLSSARISPVSRK